MVGGETLLIALSTGYLVTFHRINNKRISPYIFLHKYIWVCIFTGDALIVRNIYRFSNCLFCET